MSVSESHAYAVVVGRVVAALRSRRGMTQAQLAAAIGVTQSTLSRIESGQLVADTYTFRRIAHAFGMSTDKLHAIVDSAWQRTQRAAEGATGGEADEPWWQNALAVAGIAGLIGLAAFAVGALLSEEEQPKRRRRS